MRSPLHHGKLANALFLSLLAWRSTGRSCHSHKFHPSVEIDGEGDHCRGQTDGRDLTKCDRIRDGSKFVVQQPGDSFDVHRRSHSHDSECAHGAANLNSDPLVADFTGYNKFETFQCLTGSDLVYIVDSGAIEDHDLVPVEADQLAHVPGVIAFLTAEEVSPPVIVTPRLPAVKI